MEHIPGVFHDTFHGRATIATMPIGLFDYDTEFCPLMAWIEIHQVDHADNMAFGILNHQTDLTVCINISLLIGNIVMKNVS